MKTKKSKAIYEIKPERLCSGLDIEVKRKISRKTRLCLYNWMNDGAVFWKTMFLVAGDCKFR